MPAPAPTTASGRGDEAPADAVEWLNLEEHPEVGRRWEGYLEEEWLPWAEAHVEWRAHHRVYSALFAMRQTLKRTGEQFELVAGFGLLETRVGEAKRLRRHVLVLQAALDFGLEDGTITVRAPLEGVRPALELDMLPSDMRPSENLSAHFDQEIRPRIEGEPWARDAIDDLLRSFTNSYPDGVYLQNLAPKEDQGIRLRVTFAPALILRKRSTRECWQPSTT